MPGYKDYFPNLLSLHFKTSVDMAVDSSEKQESMRYLSQKKN